MFLLNIINWQPSLKVGIQEIREFDWFKLLAYGICTEPYQYRIGNNDGGSKATSQQEFLRTAIN